MNKTGAAGRTLISTYPDQKAAAILQPALTGLQGAPCPRFPCMRSPLVVARRDECRLAALGAGSVRAHQRRHEDEEHLGLHLDDVLVQQEDEAAQPTRTRDGVLGVEHLVLG